MKTLKDFNVKNKRVLMRCDFNVPLDNRGNILDDFRIKKTVPTIECLMKAGAKIVLMSHLGEPEGQYGKEFSLVPIQEKLLEYLDVSVNKAADCVGRQVENWTQQMQEGEILLLENLRFHKEEEENDLEFARALARLGDIYLNDAFGVSHRKHASLMGVPKFLPSGIGLLFEQEIEALSKILKKPARPLLGIIGGTKTSKIEVIKELLEKVDFLLIGGKLANTILAAKGICLSQPLSDLDIIKEIEQINLTDSRIRLPIDAKIVLNRAYVRNGAPASARKEEKVFDIGPETIKMFSQIISQAKTIFWAGPLGKIEEKQFSMGSLGIARAIANSESFSVAGGRETVNFIRQNNLESRFSHLSTGGGAMLEYLAKATLPAIEMLS